MRSRQLKHSQLAYWVFTVLIILFTITAAESKGTFGTIMDFAFTLLFPVMMAIWTAWVFVRMDDWHKPKKDFSSKAYWFVAGIIALLSAFAAIAWGWWPHITVGTFDIYGFLLALEFLAAYDLAREKVFKTDHQLLHEQNLPHDDEE